MRVFAGDKFKPAADASYKNFNAGPGFIVGYNAQKNNQIGTIDSWGPTFSVSFDLIIHSFVKGKGKQGWSSVLAFKGNGGKSHCCKHGDRIPDVALNKNGALRFSHSVSGNKKYQFLFNVDLNKWYNITIEQEKNYQKVNSFILHL